MNVKRLFDILSSVQGLIILSPLLLIIAMLIAISSQGPIIFRQTRTGRYGKPFVIFKFRTMRLDHNGSTISVKGEERITMLGAFLRRYKIDELPELWNVLKGDMSLVGPRPDVPGYADRLKGEELKILELRPGITGPASIKYRNEEEILSKQSDPVQYNDEIIWPDKIKINLDYYHNRNLVKDLSIIIRTIVLSIKRKEFKIF
jgi:lipopolysaccharide/colanic/teichoic acid biosynthesis glycosyltransferase